MDLTDPLRAQDATTVLRLVSERVGMTDQPLHGWERYADAMVTAWLEAMAGNTTAATQLLNGLPSVSGVAPPDHLAELIFTATHRLDQLGHPHAVASLATALADAPCSTSLLSALLRSGLRARPVRETLTTSLKRNPSKGILGGVAVLDMIRRLAMLLYDVPSAEKADALPGLLDLLDQSKTKTATGGVLEAIMSLAVFGFDRTLDEYEPEPLHMRHDGFWLAKRLEKRFRSLKGGNVAALRFADEEHARCAAYCAILWVIARDPAIPQSVVEDVTEALPLTDMVIFAPVLSGYSSAALIPQLGPAAADTLMQQVTRKDNGRALLPLPYVHMATPTAVTQAQSGNPATAVALLERSTPGRWRMWRIGRRLSDQQRVWSLLYLGLAYARVGDAPGAQRWLLRAASAARRVKKGFAASALQELAVRLISLENPREWLTVYSRLREILNRTAGSGAAKVLLATAAVNAGLPGWDEQSLATELRNDEESSEKDDSGKYKRIRNAAALLRIADGAAQHRKTVLRILTAAAGRLGHPAERAKAHAEIMTSACHFGLAEEVSTLHKAFLADTARPIALPRTEAALLRRCHNQLGEQITTHRWTNVLALVRRSPEMAGLAITVCADLAESAAMIIPCACGTRTARRDATHSLKPTRPGVSPIVLDLAVELTGIALASHGLLATTSASGRASLRCGGRFRRAR